MDTLSEAENALRAHNTITLNKDCTEAVPMSDISNQVETSLTFLLKSRISKIQKDIEFEDHVKQAILDRLPEAEFSELFQVLNLIQRNTNDAVEKILLPFIPRADRVPLLDNSNKTASKEAGDIAFTNAPKEVLQSLTELSKVLKIVGGIPKQKTEEEEK